jgi:hypothetical protein
MKEKPLSGRWFLESNAVKLAWSRLTLTLGKRVLNGDHHAEISV